MRRCPRAWCPDLHVHSMHPGVHVVQPRCPRRPCRPRPHHCACCTFSDMEHGAHGTHCRTVSMRTIVARCSRQDKSEKLRRQCPCREALALGVRVRPTELELELESFYSITTFIGDISPASDGFAKCNAPPLCCIVNASIASVQISRTFPPCTVLLYCLAKI